MTIDKIETPLNKKAKNFSWDDEKRYTYYDKKDVAHAVQRCHKEIRQWIMNNFQSTFDNKSIYMGVNYQRSIKDFEDLFTGIFGELGEK